MSLIKYHRPLFPSSFSGLFNNLLDETVATSANQFQPKVSISENEKSFLVNAELPGVKKENIHVDLAENMLTISGERKQHEERKNDNYHLVESSFGSFTRSFYLPKNVDQKAIEASYEDGVLSLSIPKKKENELTTKIPVK